MIRDTVSDHGDASSLLPNDGDDFVIKELDDEPGALSGDNVNSAGATSRTRGTTGRLTKALLLTNMVGIVDRRQRKEERRRQRRREQTRRQRSDQSAVSGAGADGAAAATFEPVVKILFEAAVTAQTKAISSAILVFKAFTWSLIMSWRFE